MRFKYQTSRILQGYILGHEYDTLFEVVTPQGAFREFATLLDAFAHEAPLPRDTLGVFVLREAHVGFLGRSPRQSRRLLLSWLVRHILGAEVFMIRTKLSSEDVQICQCFSDLGLPRVNVPF